MRRFREDSGNAGMVARELPPDEVLASWQHVEQRALDLRAAGVPRHDPSYRMADGVVLVVPLFLPGHRARGSVASG